MIMTLAWMLIPPSFLGTGPKRRRSSDLTRIRLPGLDSEDVQPNIHLPLMPTVIKEGEDAYFSVAVTGRPAPEVTWYHHNVKVTTQGRYFCLQDEKVFKFEIKNVESDDSGEIKCVANNAYGEAITVCSLEILGKFWFEEFRRRSF